jgi:hypothetical protein
MLRGKDNQHLRHALPDHTSSFEAAHHRHRNIEYSDIRADLFGNVDGLAPICRLTDYRVIGLEKARSIERIVS